LKDALARYGVPAIFNTDQGSQFTSYGFIRVLKDSGVEISMDGQGRWRDNIYVERFWRSLKYEDISPEVPGVLMLRLFSTVLLKQPRLMDWNLTIICVIFSGNSPSYPRRI